MTPQRRLIGHARNYRTLLRIGAVAYGLLLLVNVWDRSPWALVFAAIFAACVTGARNVTKTLDRIGA
jgi:uncharacterized membrane protein